MCVNFCCFLLLPITLYTIQDTIGFNSCVVFPLLLLWYLDGRDTDLYKKCEKNAFLWGMSGTMNHTVFARRLTTWVLCIIFCRQFGLSYLFPVETSTFVICLISWSFISWNYPFLDCFRNFHLLEHVDSLLERYLVLKALWVVFLAPAVGNYLKQDLVDICFTNFIGFFILGIIPGNCSVQ